MMAAAQLSLRSRWRTTRTRDGGGIRTLHYYADGESEAVARLTAAGRDWPGAKGATTLDPALKAIRHLDVSR